MKKIIAASAVLASSVAFAGDYKINLEGRADFVNANTKSTTPLSVTTTEKWNNFSNQLVRLNMLANVNDNLSIRFRYRFAKGSAAPTTVYGTVKTDGSATQASTSREETGTQLDYMYVDHKNSMFTTRFGKQNWGGMTYGREGIVSGSDVFLTSAAGTNYKTAFGSDYRFGVTAMFKFMDTNTLDIALSNPNSTFTDTTGTTKTNSGLAYGIFYTGNFMNKLVQPVLAYQSAKQNGDTDTGTKTKDGNHTMYNIGLRSEVAGFVIDADYKALKKDNRNDTGTTSLVKEETKSIYANLAYAVGDFTPIATYINDKFDSETNSADFKRNSFAVGTYWKPMADVNFRYHAMLTSATTKYDDAGATYKEIKDTKMYFGIKADI
jgi:hypothetical protein